MPGAWRTNDSYELLSLILIVIVAFSNHPFQRGFGASLLAYVTCLLLSGERRRANVPRVAIRTVAYGAAAVVVLYCLVPVYRLQDVALVYSLLIFIHLQNISGRRP